MNEIEQGRCDYFIAFPSVQPGGNEYLCHPFKNVDDFKEVLAEVCKKFESNPLIIDLPLMAGIGIGDDLDDYYIYNFDRKDKNKKPVKLKWVGDATLAPIVEKKIHERCFPIIFKKEMKIVRSNDTSVFYRKCLGFVDIPSDV